MTTTTVRDIPDSLYQRIKQSAIANRRSINSEIIHLLDTAFDFQLKSDAASKLEVIRQARAKIAVKAIKSEAEITFAKREGRS